MKSPDDLFAMERALRAEGCALVCGADEATADRYDARNDALRSIARTGN